MPKSLRSAVRFRNSGLFAMFVACGFVGASGVKAQRALLGQQLNSCCELKAVTAEGLEVEFVDGWSASLREPSAAIDEALILEDFPLREALQVDLVLERFRVTTAATRFVVGDPSGVDSVIDFDPESVLLLRGHVADDPESRVFLALSEQGGFGAIDHAGQLYKVSSRKAGRLFVAPSTAMGGSPLDVPLCGVEDHGGIGLGESQADLEELSLPALFPQKGVVTPIRGLRQIELAVETDHEFFRLFGDLDAASAYVVAVFAAVSEIYVRDVDARIDLTFVRLWDDPDDLFNEPNPLTPFQTYWEANMGAVDRDVAQFFSGRRNLPFGGVAFGGGLCNSAGYSVAGYAIGFFVDPNGPHVFNRDVTVTAHELGHNSNAPHTHTLGVDTCDVETSQAQRGTLMSYCGQTFTGGAANTDLRFHTELQAIMETFFSTSGCLAADCNQNGLDDTEDLSAGNSLDVNVNDIPDECEDCNGNSILDDTDIAIGASADADGDGVPDECQPDCNGNLVPDGLDIANATSADLFGNGVPDECEADCNLNTTSDYDEIQADMSLDKNRNALLDACEDCDADGTPDLEALDHAHNLWLASQDHSGIREYLASVGPLAGVSDDGGIMEAQDLVITMDRRVLVTSRLDHRVVEFTVDGALVGDLVSAASGGLSEPAGLILAPDGRLLVASRGSDAVLAYDGMTGAFLGAFVSAGAGGLGGPFGLAFKPTSAASEGSLGNLFVASEDNRVLEYDGATGAFVREFVTVTGNGGLVDPHGLLFLPSGNLLVASYGTDQILEYDGTTGALVRQFNQGGTADRLTLDQPWGLRLGPDGDVYVSRAHDHGGDAPQPLHLTNARVFHFDVDSGFLMRAFVLGVNSGVEHPTGFDFVPGDAVDCNRNLIPDTCDIADGTSQDLDGNGIPDSCERVTVMIFDDGFESGDLSAW